MIPLEFFRSAARILFLKPFDFWPKKTQQNIIREGKLAVLRLKEIFENRQLTESHAYKLLVDLESAFSDATLDEVSFIQSTANLLEVYKFSSVYAKHKEFLDQLSHQVSIAKEKILEYHVGLEILKEKAREMEEGEQKQSDMKNIQEIGFFYILEYTLYILYQLSQSTEKEKRKLFYEGLRTHEANLPPYTDFAESFRRNLCLKIFDPELRNQLLQTFFRFEEVFRTGDLNLICSAFKKFNLEILMAFRNKGAETFKAIILKPFGSEVPMDELIQKVNDIKINSSALTESRT